MENGLKPSRQLFFLFRLFTVFLIFVAFAFFAVFLLALFVILVFTTSAMGLRRNDRGDSKSCCEED